MKKIKNLWRWAEAHPHWAAFLLVSSVLICLNVLHREVVLFGDADNYWDLSGRFLEDGRFSFLNFDFPLRELPVPIPDRGHPLSWRATAGIGAMPFYQLVMSLVYSDVPQRGGT